MSFSKKINDHFYIYKSVRHGDKVSSVYLGHDPKCPCGMKNVVPRKRVSKT